MRGRDLSKGYPPDFAPKVIEALLPHEKKLYIPGDPTSPKPKRGDLIMWGDHFMMGTGELIDGSPEVYSLLPGPDDLTRVDYRFLVEEGGTRHPAPATETTAIKTFTIDNFAPFTRVRPDITERGVVNLYPYSWIRDSDPDPEIWFGQGPW